MSERIASVLRDPRHYQMAVLSTLLAYGAIALDFEVRPAIAVTITGVAIATQLALSQAQGLTRFDPRSALISSLSLCLLLRTPSLSTAALAAFIAVGSKFALRTGGRHLFNPSAIGLVAALLLTDDAWVSAGQWGSAPLLALVVVGFGSLVLRRAERSDVTWAFLTCYLTLLFGRAAWLGDPLAIPLHSLQSGAFLIFAFFMISDPRTTPDSRAGRILFAGLVAAAGFAIRYSLYHTNGLIWSLVLCAPLIPLIDRVLPGPRYRWGASGSESRRHGGSRDDEKYAVDDRGAAIPDLGAASHPAA